MHWLRVVHHHDHPDLRLIDRKKSNKGGHVLGVGVPARHRLLGRAGLAGHGVALHPGAPPGAARLCDAPHQVAHRRGGLDRDRARDHFRLIALHHLARTRAHLAHDIGLHQEPVVGDRADRAQHLQRRHRDALADTNPRGADARPALGRREDPAFFAGHIKPQLATEPKSTQVTIQPLVPQCQGHLGRQDIARFLEPVRHREAAIGMEVMQDTAPVHPGPILAVEHRLRRHRFLFKRRRNHHRLHRRARFVDIADGPVQLGHIGGMPELVQIEPRPVGQGQDLARADPLHHGPGTLGTVLEHHLVQRLLDHVLDILVNRQRHIGALERRHVTAAATIELFALGIEPSLHHARRPAQVAVELLLDTRAPRADVINETEDVTEKMLLRIVTNRRVLEEEALDAERRHLVGQLVGDVALDVGEAALRLLHAHHHLIGRHIQQGRQRTGRLDHRVALRRDRRVDADVFHAQVHRQHVGVAVAVVDRTASGQDLTLVTTRTREARPGLCMAAKM